MKYVEIIADAGSSDTVLAVAEKAKVQANEGRFH
jgi:hypothetical protein